VTYTDPVPYCVIPFNIYANYTRNSFEHVPSATCNLSITGGDNYLMQDNGVNYNQTITLGNLDDSSTLYEYSITCNKTNHITQSGAQLFLVDCSGSETPAIPEFSTTGIILAITLIVIATVLMRRYRQNNSLSKKKKNK
jgi:hypothetical protein